MMSHLTFRSKLINRLCSSTGQGLILLLTLLVIFINHNQVSCQELDYIYRRAFRGNNLYQQPIDGDGQQATRFGVNGDNGNILRSDNQPGKLISDNQYGEARFRLRGNQANKGTKTTDAGGNNDGGNSDSNGNSGNEETHGYGNQDNQAHPRGNGGGPMMRAFIASSTIDSSHLHKSGLNSDIPGHITITSRSSASSSSSSSSSSFGSFSNLFFVATVAGVTVLGIFVVISTGYMAHRINLQRKAAADVDYPAYGVTGPAAVNRDNLGGSGTNGSLSPSGDRKLAQSAQMYHYHHQKQQMIASEKVEANQHTSTSDVDSEEENEEGDYTVYECPGLASTGEIEVKNPLFQDDLTPISSPSVTNGSQDDTNKPKDKPES